MSLALKPYQIAGRDFLAARTRALLADEPGVGKTAQVITALDKIEAHSVLVVCPAIAKFHWAREFTRWSVRQVNCRILSYGEAADERRWRLASPDEKYDVLVVDEAHYGKNPASRRTKTVFAKGGAAWCARRIWCLSGTPAPNNPAELWVMLRSFGATPYEYADFIDRYCVVDWQGRVRGTRQDNLMELRRVMQPYVMRRAKADVMPELGAVDVQEFAVEPRMEWVRGDIYSATEDWSIIETVTIEWLLQHRAELATWRRMTALTKAPAVYDTIKFELDNGLLDKVVVYGYHQEPLQIMYEKAKRDDLKPEIITGKTPPKERDTAIERFKLRGSRIMLANIIAAGVAIDLTCAHQGVMLELDWVPANNAQAMQRMHRHGQSRPVTIRVAVAANTVDEVVSGVLERKIRDLTQLWSK